ncbi:S-adenosyl-L-methionine-dependent methyltransferase [Fomitopsis serialis]|uniref:S-adenosyl-L-methionine-dependent methyltransferase n=1 Tax=Fomitopsis serialis TaxID=139415 RepID=UPI0020082211|nr:S-adenosyl-L-methionine-dependent methyltransferase [Neoantrodia serialis]KAH9935336.1 S-adenosyl-L-methionine-dependent methyltransferase [Neoantrodia serialis]
MPAGSLPPVAARIFALLKRSIGAQGARNELRWMQEALKKSHATLSGSADIESMLHRRVRGEPLQYILGTQPFGPLNLLTRPPVLIPRPETEDWTIRLSERLLSWRRQPASLLDLCTGSGCIPILLCHLLPGGSLHATGVDLSDAAIQLARDNAALCGIAVPPVLPEQYGKVKRNTFLPLLGNIRAPGFVAACGLRPPYDVVTSNPPYITKEDYDNLSPSVKDWEDPRALIGDPAAGGEMEMREDARGLTFYHTIADLLASSTPTLLKSDGLVALEVGEGQASAVAEIMERKAHMKNIEIWKDPWDKERVVVGQK